jgi:hypothetical protein
MKKFLSYCVMLIIALSGLYDSLVFSQKLEDFNYSSSIQFDKNTISNKFQFNGYTDHWQDKYSEWIRYANLFKIAIPDIDYTIAQSKVDVAEDLGINGLSMEEGFIDGLLRESFTFMDNPSIKQLEESLKKNNVLVLTDPVSETGKKLIEKIAGIPSLKETLKSHQYYSEDFIEVNAFMLENNERKLFVVASTSQELRNQVIDLINQTLELVKDYDMYRGWFGAQTLLKSVTCTAGHPLEVIGKGLNEGNSWFVFDGYMDFLAKNELKEWIDKVNLPVITDVGFSPIYGCENYDGLQVQSMFTKESWINYAHEKGGYVFRQVYDPQADTLQYDGYIANEGNKEQIDNENVPFISVTGTLDYGAIPSMVIFIKKGEQLTKNALWESILSRREVSILSNCKMMGPARFRKVLEMLYLDRIFLEEYFGDRINIEAEMENYVLKVSITNTYPHEVSGSLNIILPPELKINDVANNTILNLPPESNKMLFFDLLPQASAMNKTNPIAVSYTWGTSQKSTLTMLDLPPAISVQQLLYGHSPLVSYPVSIHNFTDMNSFPVKIEVLNEDKNKKVVYTTSQTCSANKGTFRDLIFDLPIPPGKYKVKVTALGIENYSQLGVGKNIGYSHVYETDLNNDGIPEYRMENDSVRITLLTTGARVIEYFVKSRNDNVLFKLWPEKPEDDKRPFRKWGYYPYGGFEDFLGQASMETHKVYDACIIKKEGDYVQVKMTADYFGNKLEKLFTLYGNSPLLEVRFALDFKNPEANVLGPQPILELGKKHWTEDIYTVPEINGLHEYKMKPEKYWGRIFFLREGWYAGYDTEEDIAFIGAFPVSQPLFLHMWMNHPSNGGSQFYYVEFQPWTPIYQKNTMYFTYYLWGAGGPWENGVRYLRERNLITEYHN